MVCSDERNGKYPFDIRHRRILTYDTQSTSDYEKLREDICTDIKEVCKKKNQEQIVRNSRGFALCFPSHESFSGDFSHNLEYKILKLLCPENIPIRDYCFQNDSLEEFRNQIKKLASNAPPDYLLALWPELTSDRNEYLVLDKLKQLTQNGCRICFINEFPENLPDDYKDSFSGKVSYVRVDTDQAVNLLCDYMNKIIKPNGRILLLNAAPAFQVAQERKKVYEKALESRNMRYDSITIKTWKPDMAKREVLKQIKTLKEGESYEFIAAANDDMAMGAVEALQYLHLKNGSHLNTKVVGYDGTSEAKRMINDSHSCFAATIYASPYLFADVCHQLLIEKQFDGIHKHVIKIDQNNLITERLT